MSVTLSNLRYADQAGTTIDMDVSGWFDGTTIPFTYNPADNAPLTKAVKELLATGSYEIAPYQPPT